uniref:Immunoglobulin domain-containing protein n=1 Tax=Neolamprologus brichardi TaxID=32507 RepID=A0A3Q4GRQ7_NEOBR
MRRFTLITAVVFCSRSWISASEFQTVEVQHRDEVTLQCSNISAYPTQTDWFRVVDKTKPSCVSSMYGSDTSFCDGFRNGKFNMSSNNTSVFLKITQVALSDVGLYFCGFYVNKHTVISNAVELRIQGKLVGRTLVFQVSVLPLCKYSVFQNVSSDDLNYAALNFQKNVQRNRRPVTQRELEPHVVYAATR